MEGREATGTYARVVEWMNERILIFFKHIHLSSHHGSFRFPRSAGGDGSDLSREPAAKVFQCSAGVCGVDDDARASREGVCGVLVALSVPGDECLKRRPSEDLVPLIRPQRLVARVQSSFPHGGIRDDALDESERVRARALRVAYGLSKKNERAVGACVSVCRV